MKFEVVSNYADAGINLPERKTAEAAGYDFEVAEDIIIPSYERQSDRLWRAYCEGELKQPLTLQEVAALTKYTGAKPTLVPTGIKC